MLDTNLCDLMNTLYIWIYFSNTLIVNSFMFYFDFIRQNVHVKIRSHALFALQLWLKPIELKLGRDYCLNNIPCASNALPKLCLVFTLFWLLTLMVCRTVYTIPYFVLYLFIRILYMKLHPCIILSFTSFFPLEWFYANTTKLRHYVSI